MHEHKPRLHDFSKGSVDRAERDVIAAGLESDKNIQEPYAVATTIVKKGGKAKNKDAVAKELELQKQGTKAHFVKLRRQRYIAEARKHRGKK